MWLTLGVAIAKAFAVYLALAGYGRAVNSGWESYLAAHPTSSNTLISNNLVRSRSIESVQADIEKPSVTSNTARVRCPAGCNGEKPNNWTLYHDLDRLALCNRTMLLDFALGNPLDNHGTPASIRSCTADFNSSLSMHGRLTNKSCRSNKNLVQTEASLQMAWLGSSDMGAAGGIVTASQQMERYISRNEVSCNSTIAFAYSGHAVLGVYAGSGIQSQGIATTVLRQFAAHVEANGMSKSLLVQLCATNGRSSKFALGIVASANANLSFVQETVMSWSHGKCITRHDKAAVWQNITFLSPTPPSWTESTPAVAQLPRGIHPRTTCSSIVVGATDTCESLAVECGITAAQFTAYNPCSTLCSALTEGQHVCCSSGTLPGLASKPNANGTCHSYLVQGGDSCEKIARANSLTLAKLETFNVKTWGWMGCADIQTGWNICLSSGLPPMPAPLVSAVCGPQVPGTPVPPPGTDLSTLNRCALNACCNIWGQCGTTDEFCTASKGPAGAPGTAAMGTNGCISNCDTDRAVNLQSFEGESNIVGGENGVSVVYIDPIIFEEPNPEVAGTPPCVLVIPPSTIPTPTTISFEPIRTSIVVGKTIVTVVTPSPITASVISFYNVPIESGVTSKTFTVVSSLKPEPLVVSAGGSVTTITFPAGPKVLTGPQVVIVNHISYSVIGGSVIISSAGSGVGALSVSVPPARNTPQTLTLPNGAVLTIPAITSSTFYSLPTTVYESNGVTQTFSQAQFTDLATITTETTVTTALAEVGYGSSLTATSTTPVAFLVAVGGFYWSPVPLPTPPPVGFPPIRIPSLPSFPEIPSFPCFKLFDIFSINCPPDKSQPKTIFKSNLASPTCKSNCGTLCTADCNSQDDPNSSESSPSTSTSSSSTSSSSSSTSFDLCSRGCSACNASGPKASTVPRKRDLERRDLDGPDGYGSVDTFMDIETTFATYPVFHSDLPDLATGKAAAFLSQKFTMSVRGLYGCTSLVVLSQKGVYMSHFWEAPSFQSDKEFKEQVIDVLEFGALSFNNPNEYALPPLSQLTAKGNILASAAAPVFIIFAPKQRDMLRANPSLNPLLVPLMYPAMVSRLQSHLRKLTGTDSILLEYDPNFASTSSVSRYGKLLLQYDPADTYTKANGCYQQQALARFWVEGQSQDFTWPAYANQIISVPKAPSRIKKRNGKACLLTSPTATASDVKVTSTAPLPTQPTICLTSSLTGCSYTYQFVEAALCKTTTPSFPAKCTTAPSTTSPSTTAPSINASSTTAPSTTALDTPLSLPTLSAQCVTSSLVNCKWIYRDAEIADCPITTLLLPASCTNSPSKTSSNLPLVTTTVSSPLATTTLNLCYFAQYYCSDLSSECNSFDHGEYYWFSPGGSSTCETVWGESSWIGLTSVSKPEDTTYHFPSNALDLTHFTTGPTDSTKCVFTPYDGDGSGSQADLSYEGVSNGGKVGEVKCSYRILANVAICYKAYKKFDITGQGRREMVQLLTMVWNDDNYHN